jgi:tRNA-dihydrouridine synthase B
MSMPSSFFGCGLRISNDFYINVKFFPVSRGRSIFLPFRAIQFPMFRWNSMKKPIIGLSPMADMTDTPFNLLCREHGAPVIFREMASSEAVTRGNEKTFRMIGIDDAERPSIQQIFGSDPARMAEAARMIEERVHPEGIDINMGCPVRKLTGNFDGASLMRDPDLASAIVRAVKNAVSVPVSVKTRLGWSDDADCIGFVKAMQDAGADLVSIHARTKVQGYAGIANWSRVGDAKRGVSIPLLVNGDIRSADDAKRALEQSCADGFLVGRGALGNPWLFREFACVFYGAGTFVPPSMQDRIKTVLRHADLQIERYGEHGLVKLRKHLPFYFKGMEGWKEMRSKLVRVSTREELKELLAG